MTLSKVERGHAGIVDTALTALAEFGYAVIVAPGRPRGCRRRTADTVLAEARVTGSKPDAADGQLETESWVGTQPP